MAVSAVVGLLAISGSYAWWSRHAATGGPALGVTPLPVQLCTPVRSEGQADIRLSGTLEGDLQVPVIARSEGYIVRLAHEIGAQVKQGEVLAEIDNPEAGLRLTQASAARRQSEAAADLAQVSLQRWEDLHAKGMVSQQALDERRSMLAQQRANLAASEAEVQRLRQQLAFTRIVAPFAGVITRRDVSVGDMVGGAHAGKPLFVLTRMDPLRVYVQVPQGYASRIKAGMPAVLTSSTLPGRKFDGQIMRTTGVIDPVTGTMQAEVRPAQSGGALLPGAFVEVQLAVDEQQSWRVPSNTLLFRPKGVMVAVVAPNGRVQLKPVELGRDLGSTVEIVQGVGAHDRVIVNPAEAIADNDIVKVP